MKNLGCKHAICVSYYIPPENRLDCFPQKVQDISSPVGKGALFVGGGPHGALVNEGQSVIGRGNHPVGARSIIQVIRIKDSEHHVILFISNLLSIQVGSKEIHM